MLYLNEFNTKSFLYTTIATSVMLVAWLLWFNFSEKKQEFLITSSGRIISNTHQFLWLLLVFVVLDVFINTINWILLLIFSQLMINSGLLYLLGINVFIGLLLVYYSSEWEDFNRKPPFTNEVYVFLELGCIYFTWLGIACYLGNITTHWIT